MLETAAERAQLLKDGISGKKIEEMYIQKNGFTIFDKNLLWNKLW